VEYVLKNLKAKKNKKKEKKTAKEEKKKSTSVEPKCWRWRIKIFAIN